MRGRQAEARRRVRSRERSTKQAMQQQSGIPPAACPLNLTWPVDPWAVYKLFTWGQEALRASAPRSPLPVSPGGRLTCLVLLFPCCPLPYFSLSLSRSRSVQSLPSSFPPLSFSLFLLRVSCRQSFRLTSRFSWSYTLVLRLTTRSRVFNYVAYAERSPTSPLHRRRRKTSGSLD